MFDERRDVVEYGGGAAPHVRRDWRDIDRRMHVLAARRAALDLEEARLLMEAKRAEIHRHLGYGSFAEYLERVLGYAPSTGRDRVRVAEELETLPLIAEAWAEGKLAYSTVREITRVATPDTEDVVLAYVDRLTVREVIGAMRGLEKGDDPNRRREPDLEPRRIAMEVPPDTYAVFIAARRHLERVTGHPMTDAEYLDSVSRGVLAGNAGASDRPNVPPYQITFTRCVDCKRAWHDAPGQSIEVSPATSEQVGCDAVELHRIDLCDDAPPPAVRPIPPATRRAVLARDKHRCRVPGCSNCIVDVHHIERVVDGGSHAMRNLVTLCTLHHKLHHDGVITISGSPDALVVMHADGRPYGARPLSGPTAPHMSRVSAAEASAPYVSHTADATRALTTMGFKPAEAKAAVERAARHVSRDAPLEALVVAALRECPARAAPRSS